MSILNNSKVLWAKTDGTTNYYPLIHHMLDVAAVGKSLYKNTFSKKFQRKFQEIFGLSSEQTFQLMLFVFASHDIGKASWYFQSCVEAQKNRLKNLGIPEAKTIFKLPHAHVSALILKNYLNKKMPLLDIDSILLLSCCVGGHHGIFPSISNLITIKNNLVTAENNITYWNDVRIRILDELRAIFELDDITIPKIKPDSNVALMTISGFLVVCDWIASQDVFIEYESDTYDKPSVEHWKLAQKKADKIISQIGWQKLIPPQSSLDFQFLFPELKTPPRPLQATIINIVKEKNDPKFVIIEAPMGEGKTEAALLLQDYWCSHHEQRGVYFALPTMASSNQMYLRLVRFLKNRYYETKVNFHLIHSQSFFSDEYQSFKTNSIENDAEGESFGTIVADEWFCNAKRGLLAPFAVGTVDQVLLSVLKTKHGFLRMFGLSQKTIIFDEVHAYDFYMSVLFQYLIKWLRELDATVIILSATITSTLRNKILGAFNRNGIDNNISDYPRVVYLDKNDKVNSITINSGSQKTVIVEWIDEDLLKISNSFKFLLEEGGCIAWICNSVNKAQSTYAYLKKELAGENISILLFHGRYPMKQKNDIEKKVVERFEKGRSPHPPTILIATQVVEQSLDLDFDLMITEMAPADLILQRAGRLHRHSVQRPSKLNDRKLIILNPKFNENNVPLLSQTVYSEYIMLKSWLALKKYNCIDFTKDIEPIIESVYVVPHDQTDDGYLEKILNNAYDDLQKEKDRLLRTANEVLLPEPLGNNIINDTNIYRDEDNVDIHSSLRAMTRDFKPSVTVVCIHMIDQQYYLSVTKEHPISINKYPTKDEQKILLENSLTLSYNGCLNDFNDSLIPSKWKKTALLRYSRLLVFENGTLSISNRNIILDNELGIVFQNKDKSDYAIV